MKENWTYKKLGEVCEINYGTRVVQKKDKGSTYYVYGGGGATFMVDSYNREDCFIVSRFAMSPKCTRFVSGKFFLNDSGLSVSTKIDELSQPFLDKTLLANNDTIYSFGKGMAQRNLDMPSFRNLIIPIPPLPEQKHIISELDLLQSIIDKQQAQLKELDKLAQAVFYDMFGDPVENEKRWEVKMIKEVSLVKIGPFGSLLHTSDYIKGGVPLVNPIHMKNGQICPDDSFTISDEKKKEMLPYLLRKGDVVFARRGEIGRCAIVSEKEDGYLCGTGSLFVRFTEPINEVFVLYWTKSDSFIKDLISKAKGATMLNINCNIVENLQLPIPPLSLQQSFARKIESIEKQKSAISQSIAETQKLFNYTMDKYFG